METGLDHAIATLVGDLRRQTTDETDGPNRGNTSPFIIRYIYRSVLLKSSSFYGKNISLLAIHVPSKKKLCTF
jgi:hypothetical protein